MSDCFISYSRKDGEFVGRLADMLEARDKDVWVDREDIPPSAEWYEQVTQGIREADAFVAVLTPSWLESDVCSRELAVAVDLGKRLVPLMYRPVVAARLPEPLARHHWIDVSEGHPLEAGVDELINALDTDLEWVQRHTRWLIDAVRWDAAGMNRGMLPRGIALREAETWLASSP